MTTIRMHDPAERTSNTGTHTQPLVLTQDRRWVVQVAFCGAQPLLGAACFELDGLTEVVIGRGAPLGLARGPGGSARLDVPDQTISSRHARLVIDSDGRPVLEDLGSRNGTRLRADWLTAPAPVAGTDDWFVLGRTVFMVRALEAGDPTEPFSTAPGGLRTLSPALASVLRTAASLAPSHVPLLMLGETGTGKEVLCRDIHTLSARRGRMVAVNCAALPETLAESQLFGHKRGAFSDAREDREGLIQAADGGTLLLDELGDLPLPVQAKLLRVLQEGEVLPLGSTRPVKVDVRFIAAAQRPLETMVAAGSFRSDLLARLAGYVLRLPPLADRREDLGLLVASLLARHAGEAVESYRFSASATLALFARSWPLNVRELERCIEAAAVLARASHEISAEHLSSSPVSATRAPRKRVMTTTAPEMLHQLLADSLARHQGNVSAVAREMGKARMQIHRWMAQFGLDPETFRRAG
jgi:DNA-binding NtrC family response regulator